MLGNIITVLIVLSVGFFTVERGTSHLLKAVMHRYNIQPVIPTEMFIHSSVQSLLIGGMVALFIGIVINFVLNRIWLRELRQIQQAAQAISTGEFKKVEARTEDEIGQLAESINQMSVSLQALEEQRRAFLIDVAHELRTPLTSMKGYLSGIQDGVLKPTSTTFRLFQSEVQRLHRLVDSIHQLNVLEYGHQEIQLRPFNLTELTDEMWMLFEYRFEEKQIDVDYQSLIQDEKKVFMLNANRDLLAQALYNLLENAWRYTSKGGRVELSVNEVSYPGVGVMIRLVNQYQGPHSIDTDKLFDRFYRGEHSRSRTPGGLGIGLAIVRQIVLSHKGKIRVDSTQGNFSIEVWLPRIATWGI